MISRSVAKTKKTAKELAEKILEDKKKRNSAFVLALEGDLGGGKTTFLQGFAKGLGVKEKVTSPTFNIFRKYRIKKPGKANLAYFYHFDCYRIKKTKEISGLGFKEIIQNPENIVAIEWAGRIKKILPKNARWINFDFVDKDKRAIDFL